MIDKNFIFKKISEMLQQQGFTVINKNDARPWGGFYVINDTDAPAFVKNYFPEENIDELNISEKISPKILLLAPNTRLSWQYHFRRAEMWRCVEALLLLLQVTMMKKKKK